MTINPDRFVGIFFFVAALLLAMPSHARDTSGFFSGAYLKELCDSDMLGRETVAGGHTACQSYIAGVIDYHRLTQSLNVAPVIDICVPNTIPMKRLQSIVWTYLKKHGENSEFIAAPAVALALYPYFPCKKKR